MKKLLGWLLIGHLLLAGAVLATMDMDLAVGPLRLAFNGLIDGYEVIGFGVLNVGLAVVAVVLGVPWLWLRARAPGSN